MSHRGVAAGGIAVAAVILGALGPAATAGPGTPTPPAKAEWKPVHANWPGRQGVAVSDVVSFDKVAFVSATTTKSGQKIPWVQRCSPNACTATRLPTPTRNGTSVTSISGSAVDDVWAVGTTVTDAGLHNPVWWHKDATGWSLVDTGIAGVGDDIGLKQVEVANASKAFAIGRFDYVNGVTTTLYRFNGSGWKEISPVGDTAPVFPGACDGWYNRGWDDVITRPGSALLVGTCGSRDKPYVLEQGDTDWSFVTDPKLPTDVRWTGGSFIAQQVWLVGQRGDKRFIVARDGASWSRVTTQGIRPSAQVLDLAGLNGSKLTAVGHVPTGRNHRIARAWRWGAGSWHETEVPAGVSKSSLFAIDVDGSGPSFAVGSDAARKPWQRGLIVRSIG